MEKILAQGEIDALFAEAATPPASGPEPYNFGRAGQISSDQLRAISDVNDLFARNLARTLGAWLRTEFTVNLVSGERMAYSEHVERLHETTYVCLLRMEPLGALGLLGIELALAAPMIDILLGGKGIAGSLRPLTEIEDLIMVSVAGIFIKQLNLAWQPTGLQFSFEKREPASQLMQTMPAAEKTLCVTFEAGMLGSSGMVSLCFPSVVLNTTLRRLGANHERTRRSSAENRARMSQLLEKARVGAVLQLPTVRLRATEIASLSSHHLLRLPLPRHAGSELKISGLRISGARPVRTGEHRGARLESGSDSVGPASSDSGDDAQ